MRHAAIISIDMKLLLLWLDFKGGTIHRVYMDDDILEPDKFNIVLEHPDLPEVKVNLQLPVVRPTMQIYYAGDGSILKIERVEPPKRVGN